MACQLRKGNEWIVIKIVGYHSQRSYELLLPLANLRRNKLASKRGSRCRNRARLKTFSGMTSLHCWDHTLSIIKSRRGLSGIRHLASGKRWRWKCPNCHPTVPCPPLHPIVLTLGLSRFAGDALAIGPAPRSSWVIVAPFALPGEKIRVRVYRSSRLHSFADLLDVISPNAELRDNNRIQCQYFGKCSGCQYQVCLYLLLVSEYSIRQMLSYESQLDIKRDVVIKAYHNFSSKWLSTIYVLLALDTSI